MVINLFEFSESGAQATSLRRWRNHILDNFRKRVNLNLNPAHPSPCLRVSLSLLLGPANSVASTSEIFIKLPVTDSERQAGPDSAGAQQYGK